MPKTDLVPLRVKIRYGKHSATGKKQHLFPNFNQLPSNLRGDMDWSEYIDVYGTGWHYDNKSGIGEVDSVNPDPDIWFGCFCVPLDFATAAVALFPADVEIVNEVAFENFYNNRAHDHVPAIADDIEALQALKIRIELGNLQKIDQEYIKAMDPDDTTPGRTRNPTKTWEGCKTNCGYTIHPLYKKP